MASPIGNSPISSPCTKNIRPTTTNRAPIRTLHDVRKGLAQDDRLEDDDDHEDGEQVAHGGPQAAQELPAQRD